MASDRTGAPASLDLDAATRSAIWGAITEIVERNAAIPEADGLGATVADEALREALARLDPDVPMAPQRAVDLVIASMRTHQLHASHPGYFGLFVPAPAAIGVAAEALVASFNPQLASRGHAPFAVEAERWVVQIIGQRLGFAPSTIEGTITTGGSEANLTALLVALHHVHPSVVRDGLGALAVRPTLYVSSEAHHSWRKAARVAGLGDRAVRVVPCDGALRMDLGALRGMLREDRAGGGAPFLVVATVGATASGAIDPVPGLRTLASAEDIWLHADAAWGGGAAFSARHRHVVPGLATANSLTLDAHKWMSVPMGAGIYVSRHPSLLRDVFSTQPPYLPTTAASANGHEPYQESLLWSRRFNGLKVLLLLVTAGWQGIEAMIDACFDVGDYLRGALRQGHWRIVSRTPLPLVCFRAADHDAAPPSALAAEVVRRGRSWVSCVSLPGVGDAVRACVSNHRTTNRDVDTLLADLESIRRRLPSQG